MPETLALILVPRVTEGRPRTNMLSVAGKPVLGWTIEAARQSSRVDRVVVSTDDPEIAEIARRFDADLVGESTSDGSEPTSTTSALLHALTQLRESEGYEPELLVLLKSNSPLTTSADIDGTIAALERDRAETALTVVPFDGSLWGGGGGTGQNHENRVRATNACAAIS